MRHVHRWSVLIALLAVIVSSACVAASAAAQGVPASRLERVGDIARWDEAMPLGNGLSGALVWGEANTVRISLDRGDLWDLRTPDTLKRPDWTWETIQRLRAAGDYKQINQLFDVPYDTVPYPTKLPGGRIELVFDRSVRVSRFVLDLAAAEAVVTLLQDPSACAPRPVAVAAATSDQPDCTSEVRVRLDAVQRVGFISVRGTQPGIRLVRPAGLDRLGYGAAKMSESGEEWTLRQEAAQSLSYAVVVKRGRVTPSQPSRYAFIIDSARDGRDVLAGGRARVTAALAIDEATARRGHAGWWTRFWNTSSVRIPDERLQRHYDLVKYFYGAASRADAPPIPLQGVWTADAGDLPPWKGDYHHDLNTQMTYLAYPAAGLFEQGLSFLNQLWTLLPRFREFGRSFYGVPEAIVPGVMAADGQPLGGWAQYSLSPTNSAWVAQSFYLHWKYTADARFLRDRAYPWCAEIGGALRKLLRPDGSGRLKLPLSSSPEIFDNSPRAWLTPNTNYDLSLMRFLFAANAEMADALGDRAAARSWQETLAHLDPLLIDASSAALMVTADVRFDQSHRHFSHAMAIYPLGTLHVEGTDADRRTVNATIDGIAQLGTRQWVGYSFSWFAAMAARAAQPDRALEYLKTYERAFTGPNGFHLNGDQTRSGLSAFTYRPFTLEGNFLAMQAVHEMLLQSWGGVVRIFPATSASWRDASFARLRAEGGWIVTAERHAGQTTRVEVLSTAGGLLRLRNPFGKTPVEWSRTGVKREGTDFVVTLGPGERLIASARPNPAARIPHH
jgi:alpha-L-fucosidase 2